MNMKNLPSSVLLALGGLLSLASSLPLISDFFPLLTFPGGQLTFLGTRLPNKVTITQINGWTLIGFAGYELAIFFMLLGAVGLLLALNGQLNLIPFESIKGISINGIIAVLFGLLANVLLVLVYIGPIDNVNGWGFSMGALDKYSVTGYYGEQLIGATLGPGFYFLTLAGVLILVGGILHLVLRPEPRRSKPVSS